MTAQHPGESGEIRRWYHRWNNRRLLIELGLTIAGLALALVFYSNYLSYNESRPGVVLDDPLLAILPVHDVSVPVFALIYGGIALGIYSLLTHPRSLLVALRAYTLLIVVRIATLYVTPLAPPPDMIPLYDPLVGLGPGEILHRDLFFSGHTSTLFLLFLTAHGRLMRMLFLLCTMGVAVMVLIQHCHYTIDVIAAPFFAYGCYRVMNGVGKG